MAQISMMPLEQARSYMDGNKPDSFTLLDVRQEWEYAQGHIPGARLIPLVELPDRLEEIDSEKPVLVYCASGGRSMAASVLLEGQGFRDVSNLIGGFMSWQGHTAFGPMELGLVEFTGRETPEEVVAKAYAMENSLQLFYIQRADMAETIDRIQLFMELADFEDRHKSMLHRLYCTITGTEPGEEDIEEVLAASSGLEVEGGVDIDDFLDEHPGAFDNDQGILQLAIMIEAQALDYYLRCAARAENEETINVLQRLAREEKGHLKVIGKFMDRRGV